MTDTGFDRVYSQDENESIENSNHAAKISTGIDGLDEILEGGLIPGRSYLISGGPGSGKTTLGLHFLTSEKSNGIKNLFISLSEAEEQIRKDALSMGFDLSSVFFLDLSPNDKFFSENQTYDIFMPSEVEREPMTNSIISEIERLQPVRVFVDSMTQLRYMTPDNYQFRKQVLSFVKYMTDRGITVLFTSESTPAHPDDDLQFMCDGMIILGKSDESRVIEITKLRGSSFRSGKHIMKITSQGIKIFPKLLPNEFNRKLDFELLSSGIGELDNLTGGGIERGTTTIITGPSGIGKTTLGVQFMKEAAERGETSAVYSFEEIPDTIILRSESVKINVNDMIENGNLTVEYIEPLLYSPDEFSYKVKNDIAERNLKIIMIDSIAGYKVSMKGIDLITHLHALSKYLVNRGISVVLINESESVNSEFKATDIGISYLADNIIFLRYIELFGELKKAIGVLKKRLSNFEKSMREFEITEEGIKVGSKLSNLRNILSGSPQFITDK